jgi:hypothetical protein
MSDRICAAPFASWLISSQLGEVFQQHSVDEDIPAADFAQNAKRRPIIEEARIIEGSIVVTPEDEAEDKVHNYALVRNFYSFELV